MSGPERKRSVKRKALEDKVLSKARKYVKFSEGDQNESEEAPAPAMAVPTITLDLAPKVKLRKPRTGKKSADKTAEKQGLTKATTASPAAPSKSKKRKKHRNKNTAPPQMVATPESGQKHSREALKFLKTWNDKRSEWKFEKLKQIWLLKNALKSAEIDNDNFEVLLKYVGSVKGRAQKVFLEEMEGVVKKYEDSILQNPKLEDDKEEKVKYDRARQLVQMLNDD